MITLVYPADGPLEHFIPLGIASVGAFLQCHGVRVKVLDMRFHQLSDLKQAAKTSQFISFSAMSLLMNKALRYAQVCKQANPQVKIIFGGPHPSIFPRETLKNKQVDFVVIGEGELTTLDLVRHSDRSEKVEGIGFKKRRKVIITRPRKLVEDLDTLPFADRDLFPVQAILKKTPYWPCLTPYPQLSMISTRGCPYNCAYCQPTLRKIFGNVTRRRSPQRTVDEMEYLSRRYQPASIFMADDLFTAEREWTLATCREIRKRGLEKKLIWECESRANTFTPEIARELKKSGCYMVWFGTESYCQNTLNTLRKGTTVEQNLRSLKLCQKYKLLSLEQLMVGNPAETLEDLYQTLETSQKVKADVTAVAVTTPVPGTDLYNLLKEQNLLLTKRLDDLGSCFKGKMKFRLRYDKKHRDLVYDQLKVGGEISLRFLLTRDYYRAIFFKRMKSHVVTGNWLAILVDWGRIFYRASPAWVVRPLNKMVDSIKELALKS